jgi:fructokinase
MPSKIYTIGETVLDLIFKEFQPRAAKAGGSMLNAAISLGRVNAPVHFISEYATDEVGDFIDSFLVENGVNTKHVYRFDEGKSALALAFLDQENNASYSFYKAYPENRLQIEWPKVEANDIILFGSFYGMAPELREFILPFIRTASEKGAIIIYDPNFRKSHLHELDALKPIIVENMALADVVRGSNEDFNFIFGLDSEDDTWDLLSRFCRNLVITTNKEGARVYGSSGKAHFPVEQLNPVSTIGAGDNFNAGMVYALWKTGVTKEELTELPLEKWTLIVRIAIQFASATCLSYDNYIPVDFLDQLHF